MNKFKYFLPPLLASLSIGILFIPLNLINNWSKYSELDEIFSQIIGALVFTPFIYITALPIHLLGCGLIKILKYINCYSLLTLLTSGFSFGFMYIFFFNYYKGSGYEFAIITGLSGMIGAWSYYCIDKKEEKEKNKNIEDKIKTIEYH